MSLHSVWSWHQVILHFFFWPTFGHLPFFRNCTGICFRYPFHSRILISGLIIAPVVSEKACRELPSQTVDTNFDPVIHIDNVDGGMGAHLRYTNDNSDLVAKGNSVCKRSCPHWEWSYINGILNRIIRFSFDLEMRRLKEPFRRRSPELEAESSHCTSTSSDMLASAIKGLGVMETAVDGLPIPRIVKPVISTIRTVLQSAEVKTIDYLHLG